MGKFDVAPTVAAGLIRTARDRASLTQAQLARLAKVSQQTVSAYETGRKEPTFPTLQRLLAAAGFEIRVRIEPIERHDEALAHFLDSLPVNKRRELERERHSRAKAARLRRVKGH
ncbi:MAG: helix-turn-helix transcriptional regulator [Actinobacteria bacterium]|nr:helix-turn-helix transcriptional regulator [Actinomycetota bacterium]